MKTRQRQFLFLITITIISSGCSLMFVAGPPEIRPAAQSPAVSCTTSNLAPAVDAVLAGLLGARMLMGPGESQGLGDIFSAPQLFYPVVGVMAGGLVVSALSGFKKVNKCLDFLASQAATDATRVVLPSSTIVSLPESTQPLWTARDGWRPGKRRALWTTTPGVQPRGTRARRPR